MQDHLSDSELHSYIGRRLPARDLRRFDAHLAQCARCSGALARAAGSGQAVRLLRAVERAEPHLSYEQMEGFVDARLAAAERASVLAHTSWCARCAAELADLQAGAPTLAHRLSSLLPRRDSLVERLAAWFGTGAGPRVALALFVGAVALTLVWRDPFSLGGRGSEDLRTGGKPASGAPRTDFDRSVLEALGNISPQALNAYRAGDHEALARILMPLANRGEPTAQTALGLLYAEGRGVPTDLKRAEQLWAQAAGVNAAARHNLQVLRERESARGRSPQ
jgi:hypothetical protein